MDARRARAEGRVAAQVDHVLFAVADLQSAADEFEQRYGLASVDGGRHPGWGTANRIVPLGDSYLELIAVVDPAEAEANTFGRWVGAGAPGLPLGWAVRTDHIDDKAARLGLDIVAGARDRSDGTRLSWKLAGVEQAAADPALPFFIEWGPGTPLPGQASAPHGSGPLKLASVELTGDPERLRAWLGPEANLPVEIAPGASGVRGVVLEKGSGERVSVPEH